MRKAKEHKLLRFGTRVIKKAVVSGGVDFVVLAADASSDVELRLVCEDKKVPCI